MNPRLLSLVSIALAAAAGGVSRAAAPAQPQPPGWSTLLTGRWSCTGGFPSGRPLAADVEFTPTLGGKWIQYHHKDRAPGSYEVLALFGPVQSDTTPVHAVFHDNGGGARRFNAAGWVDGVLTLVRDSTDVKPRAERFTFRRVTDSTFWFAWELQANNAWRVGDSLTCVRGRS